VVEEKDVYYEVATEKCVESSEKYAVYCREFNLI